LKKIFLVHGEYDEMVIYKDAWIQKGFKNIEIPARNDSFYLA
jgi:hypothetical protein